MRVLHIVGTVSPQAGGPTEVIRMLIRNAPPGYTSELVTLDDPAASFLRELPFPVHALGSRHKRWFHGSLIGWLRANRGRFDGIIVHGLWDFTGLATWLSHGDVPYLLFPHGVLDPYFKNAAPAKHLKKWLYWLCAGFWIMRSADRVLFTTATERDLARHSFWPHQWRSTVVPLGSEPPPRDPDSLRSAFEAVCPDVQGRRFLLFLGRIDEKKGCDLLVRAFAKICHANPAVHLVMAGPDPLDWRRKVEPLLTETGCADRVHWPGMLCGDTKWGAFAACEAFVLPSHQENFGIAVVEALASGRPVLLTRTVNIAGDLGASGCALIEPDTQEGVSRLLTRWLEMSAGERKGMGARAHDAFLDRYDMRRNAELTLQVFEQLPARHHQANPLPEAR